MYMTEAPRVLHFSAFINFSSSRLVLLPSGCTSRFLICHGGIKDFAIFIVSFKVTSRDSILVCALSFLHKVWRHLIRW